MSRRTVLLHIMAVLFGLSFLNGCSKPTAESVASEMTGKMNEVVDVLKTVKDDASAKSGAEKIKTIVEAFNKIKAQGDALPEAEKKLLAEKKPKESEAVIKAVLQEMERIGKINPKLLGPIGEAMQGMSK